MACCCKVTAFVELSEPRVTEAGVVERQALHGRARHLPLVNHALEMGQGLVVPASRHEAHPGGNRDLGESIRISFARHACPGRCEQSVRVGGSTGAVQHLALEQLEVGDQSRVAGCERLCLLDQRRGGAELALRDPRPRQQIQLPSTRRRQLGGLRDLLFEERQRRGEFESREVHIGDEQAKAPGPHRILCRIRARQALGRRGEGTVDLASPHLLLRLLVEPVERGRRGRAGHANRRGGDQRDEAHLPAGHADYSGQDPLVSTSLTEPDPPVGDPSSIRIIVSRRVLHWMISSPK